MLHTLTLSRGLPSSLTRGLTFSLTFGLLGCPPKGLDDPDPVDTGFAFRDTAPVLETGEDTAPPPDSTDTTTDSALESGIDTAIDTAPIDTGTPSWLALDVYPGAMIVHVGATWTLRVVATDPDDLRGDVDNSGGLGALFTSDDPAVATVEATGLVTAIAAGTTTLRVALGGLETVSTVEVRADGVATITVLDARTGLPIEDANVAIPFTAPVRTDATGVALLPVIDGGPLTFSAWVDDSYDALTVTGVVGRQLTVSVLPKDTDLRSAALVGPVDFAGVDDAGWSDVVVGFAAGSIQGALASVKIEDLFAEDRAVTVFGVAVDAPANLFIEGTAGDYAATAVPGDIGVWGLGGPIAVADVTAGLSGAGDALGLLAANLGAMSWGHVTGLTATEGGTTTTDLAPADRFDDTQPMTLPALSIGFHGDESLFVLVTEETVNEGYIITGLGTGTGLLDVATVPAGTVSGSLGTQALAYAQVGGVGSGGATSTAIGSVASDGTMSFVDLQEVAVVSSWDAAARAIGATVDGDADFVRIRLRDDVNRVHDILAPASWAGTLPNCVTGFRLAHAEVEVLSLQTADGTYEGWLATGDLDPDTKSSVAAARTMQEN